MLNVFYVLIGISKVGNKSLNILFKIRVYEDMKVNQFWKNDERRTFKIKDLHHISDFYKYLRFQMIKEPKPEHLYLR